MKRIVYINQRNKLSYLLIKVIRKLLEFVKFVVEEDKPNEF